LKIKIAFSDFWVGFKPDYNWFFLFLKKHFQIELSEEPDFLIYSAYGYRHLTYNCIKIFYSGENVRPDFTYCDYALTFDFVIHSRHLRLPLYAAIYGMEPEKLLISKLNDIEQFLDQKKEFCAMVVSQAKSQKRIDFFHKLSKYKKVHSGGKLLNNVGGPIKNKIEFISNFKFTFAFENSSYPGYVTEKIFEPMFVNSVPIYWGSPLIHLDFNTKSFVNHHDYINDEEVIERIIELDIDKYKMADLLNQSWFTNNQLNEFCDKERLRIFFERIFSENKIPIASTFIGKINIYRKNTKIIASKLKKSILH
jgi:hypothetical protein